jgi:hypothetical protein
MADNDYHRLCEVILNAPRTSIHTYNNAECIKCNGVYKRMFRVGAFVMCAKCCRKEFTTEDPVRKEKAKYKKWLAKYMEN